MRSAGIDIGSRSTQLVVVDGQEVVASKQADTGYDPLGKAKRLLDGVQYDRIMATGYGRHLLELSLDTPTVTEIKAYAVGARRVHPEVRTVLDIGGQDAKVIALTERGRIGKFEMNDRCAAGTGKFLEIMAASLGYSLDGLGEEALQADKEVQINSMCTVFAESEVTSLLARGEDRRSIALGLHRSVVRRALSMLKRISVREPLLFAGGVALNPCVRRLLEETLGVRVVVPENPQIVGALGAALLGLTQG